MLSATLWYTRMGAVTDTIWPFWYSCVGSMSVPAGPVPLIPNRLWSLTASTLWPQPDSSIAWAMVTDAGTPYRLCAARAPGATSLMKACWAAVPGTCAAVAGGLFLVYEGVALPDEPRDELSPPACSPGMAAVPACWPRPAPAPGRPRRPPRPPRGDPARCRSACPASPPCSVCRGPPRGLLCPPSWTYLS